MHRAAHAANYFFVRRIGLKIEPGLVERLQQLVGAFEEERAQLRVAIVGEQTHAFTSSRWYAVPLFSCTMRKQWHRVPAARGKRDRKSTRLNSSHANISYAVF